MYIRRGKGEEKSVEYSSTTKYKSVKLAHHSTDAVERKFGLQYEMIPGC